MEKSIKNGKNHTRKRMKKSYSNMKDFLFKLFGVSAATLSAFYVASVVLGKILKKED